MLKLQKDLDQNEKIITRLQLLKTPGIGKVTFFHLIEVFGNSENAIKELPKYSKKEYKIPSKDNIKNFIKKCIQQDVHLIFFDDSRYPQTLLDIIDYPPLIYCKGNIDLLNKPSLAIVGSRNSSLQAKAFTKKIISDLDGFVIISGFAKGIDAIAHEQSLSSGTIAVFGCGVTHIYPQENKDLYDKILLNNGLLVSEIGIDDTPKQNFFSYRNRLISGISRGVLVVEAGFKSGSLITSDYALDQGRPIFSVPSHPFDPKSIGTNYLIKNGAILTRNAEDILDELNVYKETIQNELIFETLKENNIDDVKSYIIKNLSCNQILIKDLMNTSPYHIKEMNSALAQLELDNQIKIDYYYIQKVI